MNENTVYVRNIGDTIVASLRDVWESFLLYVPSVVAALVVLIIGWVVAMILSDIVRRLVQFTGIDSVINKTQINERLGWSNQYHLLSGIIGTIVKWLIIIATLMAVADILNLPQITVFLERVLLYIPQVIVAVIILTVGIIAANFVSGILGKAFAASRLNVEAQGLITSVAKYAIIVFSVMAALTQLGIVPHLIQILFGGVVLALALAFGLGGRDEAARFLGKLREREMAEQKNSDNRR